jgi:prepilin-type N-terminal cleavage/methylation domain-containing protein
MDNEPRPAGFTLPEIMVVVILLSVAMASASWVFRSSLLMLHRSEQAAGAVGRLSEAMEMMRRDVAGAIHMETGAHGMTLRTASGKTIEWECGKGTWRRQAPGAPARLWSGMPAARFHEERAGVMVEWPDAPLHGGGRAWLGRE